MDTDQNTCQTFCVCLCALPPQYLQQLSDTIMMFCLIDKSVEQQHQLNKLETLVLTVSD